MIFTETPLQGAYIIEIEPIEDERGFFARSFCRKEFEAHDLNPDLVQCNISLNKKKGTLRGMHYQTSPYEEAKVVRCTMGAIYDVIIDIRPDSPTFKQWHAVELTSPRSSWAVDGYRMLFIPEGFAHGFQTLEDNTEVFYQMSEYYHPKAARGICWDDPMFQISWPLKNSIMSEKDQQYPLFEIKREI